MIVATVIGSIVVVVVALAFLLIFLRKVGLRNGKKTKDVFEHETWKFN